MNKLSFKNRLLNELKTFDAVVGFYLSDEHGNVYSHHGDEPFETASTIKSFILLAAFEKGVDLHEELQVKDDHYADGSGVLKAMSKNVSMKINDLLTLMIIVSDNTATNTMIEYLGMDYINEVIKKYGFLNTSLNRPINFDKYSELGTTTPKDYGHFFEKLNRGELVSKEASEAMIEIFKKQHYQSLLTGKYNSYTRSEADEMTEEETITVASKSGSMRNVRCDGGIVMTSLGHFVITIFAKDFFRPFYYDDVDAFKYGGNLSRVALDQFLALGGRFELEKE